MSLRPFRLATNRDWSKQHPRIRTPRPLVDRFNLGNLHPNKEWWRERRVAPATFMGFPDVTKADVRGGALYTEQMDAATLAVIVDKCVEEKILNSDFWAKFSWRTQQLCPKLSETEVAYLFRGFSRADWFDSHLALSLWGRIDWLLPRFPLGDLSVVVEGFANPKFRNDRYERKVLQHMLLLVEARSDWTPDELVRAAASLANGGSVDIRKKILEKISTVLDSADLSLVGLDRQARALQAFANLEAGHLSEGIFAILRDLKESGKLQQKPRETLGDESVLIASCLVRMGFWSIERSLISDLLVEFYDGIYKLSHASLLEALTNLMGSESCLILPSDHEEILLRRIGREAYKFPPETACRVISGLVKAKVGASTLAAEAVAECVTRLGVTGLDGLSNDLILALKSDLEKIPDKSSDVMAMIEIVTLLE